MDKIAKAVGAAQGGVAAGIAMAGIIVGGMSEGQRAAMPWWGYAVLVAGSIVVCTVLPMVTTYTAPANVPAVGDKAAPPAVGDTAAPPAAQ